MLPQPLLVQDDDPTAAQGDEPLVGELTEDLGGRLARGRGQGGQLLVGELDLDTSSDGSSGGGCGEGHERPGDAFGNRLEDCVGELLLQLADATTQRLGDPCRDPGVAEEEPAYVAGGHHADDDVVEGLGEAVVHLLPDDDHLTEDRAGLDDRGGQCSAVGGDPEDPDPALLEDEEGLQGLVRGVDELP